MSEKKSRLFGILRASGYLLMPPSHHFKNPTHFTPFSYAQGQDFSLWGVLFVCFLPHLSFIMCGDSNLPAPLPKATTNMWTTRMHHSLPILNLDYLPRGLQHCLLCQSFSSWQNREDTMVEAVFFQNSVGALERDPTLQRMGLESPFSKVG